MARLSGSSSTEVKLVSALLVTIVAPPTPMVATVGIMISAIVAKVVAKIVVLAWPSGQGATHHVFVLITKVTVVVTAVLGVWLDGLPLQGGNLLETCGKQCVRHCCWETPDCVSRPHLHHYLS